MAAQNCRSGGAGAFTGEVLAEQLADLQVPWVVLGHSERRALYGDTDAEAAAKAAVALRSGLQVIFCIGETLGEREAGQTLDVCRRQLQALVDKVGQDLSKVVLAYGARGDMLQPTLSLLKLAPPPLLSPQSRCGPLAPARSPRPRRRRRCTWAFAPGWPPPAGTRPQ